MSLITKRALAASFKKLLNQKTLNNITVQDITLDCGLNRQTFYYHFQDIYDLLEWIFDNDTESFLATGSAENWQQSFVEVFCYLKENRTLVINTYHSVSRSYLEKFLKERLHPLFGDLVASKAKGMDISQEDLDFIVNIYVLGIIGITLEWIDGNMQDDFLDLKKFFTLIDGSIKNALLKFDKSNRV